MNYEKALQTVWQSDSSIHWVRVDGGRKDIHVFIQDVNLRIETDHTDDTHRDVFQEPWANKHADPSANSFYCNIYYGNTLLERVILVSVDGGRANLPLPRPGTNEVSPEDYVVAEIYDHLGTLGDYMQRSGLTVREKT